MSNNDLDGFMFRNNNGVPEFSMNNGTTWQKIGGSGMPTLNYTSPLHNFSSGADYTATKDCYLVGSISNLSAVSTTITINNTPFSMPTGGTGCFINLKLTAGDTVHITGSNGNIHVLEEK